MKKQYNTPSLLEVSLRGELMLAVSNPDDITGVHGYEEELEQLTHERQDVFSDDYGWE